MEFVQNLLRRAEGLAHATPDSRNRYVDFLRAASIAVVIFGHWLVAAPSIDASGGLVAGNMLAIAPWTQWLTLAVQVMPIFFLVGGYANAVAWEAAQRNEVAYGDWLAARFQRLIAPVIPVLVAWALIGAAALGLGLPGETVGLVSQVALVPTWFLAVYVMVGVLVPWTHKAWKRYGFHSFAALVVCAIVVDMLSFGMNDRRIGLVNYGFVWLAIHQLGYAWRDGRLKLRLLWAAAGAAVVALLVQYGPYPIAMVGVPGDEISNTSPPTIALLALGVAQTGLVLRLEGFARRLLDSHRVWTATVLINGMIMSVYLWHMTVMIAMYGLDFLAGGFVMSLVPNQLDWWLSRPFVMLAMLIVLIPFVGLVARFEDPGAGAAATSKRRLVPGAIMVCLGLALISEHGVAGAQGFALIPAFLPLVGSGLAGIGPLGRLFTRVTPA